MNTPSPTSSPSQDSTAQPPQVQAQESSQVQENTHVCRCPHCGLPLHQPATATAALPTAANGQPFPEYKPVPTDLVPIQTAAQIFGYLHTTIRRWKAEGKIRVYGSHGTQRVSLADIANLALKNRRPNNLAGFNKARYSRSKSLKTQAKAA